MNSFLFQTFQRVHQVLGNCLRTFQLENQDLNEEDPCKPFLTATASAIRSTHDTTLKATPRQLVFGHDMILPLTFKWHSLSEVYPGLPGCGEIGVIRTFGRYRNIVCLNLMAYPMIRLIRSRWPCLGLARNPDMVMTAVAKSIRPNDTVHCRDPQFPPRWTSDVRVSHSFLLTTCIKISHNFTIQFYDNTCKRI